MKTTANFRKAAVRTAAVIVSFILISFTVSAQEFWKKLLTNSSFNEIAIAMVEPVDGNETLNDSKISDAEWKHFEMAFDPALELEGWMSDEGHFMMSHPQEEAVQDVFFKADSEFLNLSCTADVSEPLVLEAWMMDGELWVK